MSTEHSRPEPALHPGFACEGRTAASYERELTAQKRIEARLREALALEEDLLLQKDALIRQQEILSRESDHRLLNGLQMIVSLLQLQSRASDNPQVASQLAVAANRVTAIERVHRRLHYLDGAQNVAFGKYLEDLCHDFSAMLSLDGRPENAIAVEAIDADLPTAVGIPLSFIVNELITNAVKYGEVPIAVRLEAGPGKSFALSVSNDGPALPEGFDPAAGNGLGMRLIRSFVGRIGGQLRTGCGDGGRGARFTILFS